MDALLKKKLTSGKGEKDRVPALFKELIERCTANNIEAFIIPAVLSQKPKPGQMWNTYLIERESLSENISETFKELIKIYVAFPNYDKSGHPLKFFIKDTKISGDFLNTFCPVLFKYERITTLKLMDCGLSKQAIEILHSHLINMPNITEITLDGNPINAQNHGLLTFSNTLQNLSLKRCKINEVGIENLYQNLTKCQQPKLQILNLTGNYINDTAAVVIEKILRENRSLSTLILADNWITDVGCFSIMSALQKFTLNSMEIIKKRSITIDHVKKKLEMTEEYKKEKLIINIAPIQPPTVKPSKKTAKSKKKSTARSSAIHSAINKQVSEYVENFLPKIVHPFICEIESIDGNLICTGNLVLEFLNLGYNRLTSKGYKYIIDVLNYQWTKEQIQTGLSYIILNGNLDLQSYEYDEVNRIINDKRFRIETKCLTNTIEDFIFSNINT